MKKKCPLCGIKNKGKWKSVPEPYFLGTGEYVYMCKNCGKIYK